MSQTDDPNFAYRMQLQYDRSNEKLVVLEALNNIIGERNFRSSLDIACGPGELTKALSEKSDSLTLVEITESYRELLHKKFPKAKIIIDSIDNLHFEASFDAILFSHAYYYWTESEWVNLTKRILSFLRPGASLFLVMNSDSGDWWKMIQHFWSQFPETKTFSYRAWSLFKKQLSELGQIKTIPLRYYYKFPEEEAVEVLNASVLAFTEPKMVQKYKKQALDFCNNFDRENGLICMNVDCEVIELKTF